LAIAHRGDTKKGGKAHDHTVHETGVILVPALSIFYAAGAARGMREHATHQPSPFFLTEKEIETHGRKTWYDRIMDADPGSTSFVIAEDYQERPPRKIAVLPFVDEGKGTYLIDKISVKTRDKEELTRWSWTHTNRVRRAFAGDLATREFVLVPLLTVDAMLAHHGITDRDKLNAVPPKSSGAGWVLIPWSTASCSVMRRTTSFSSQLAS